MSNNKNSQPKWVIIGYLTGVILIICGVLSIYHMISLEYDLLSSINGGSPCINAGVIIMFVTYTAKKKLEIKECEEKIRKCEEKIKKYENKI